MAANQATPLDLFEDSKLFQPNVAGMGLNSEQTFYDPGQRAEEIALDPSRSPETLHTQQRATRQQSHISSVRHASSLDALAGPDGVMERCWESEKRCQTVSHMSHVTLR